MKIKNNKGFTLIELLVTVIIMLSILGVAIVSFVSISNRKKEEAWGSVKEQIETAAEQYFKSNEYLFEGFSGNITGTISVGKLVADDYINVVTNPITGKKIDKCSVVKVTKTNGVFIVKFDETIDNNNCNSNNSVIVSEIGAPEFTLGVDGTKGTNEWFITDVILKVVYDSDNENNKIVSSDCRVGNSVCGSDIYDSVNMIVNQKKDIAETEYCITLKNNKGKNSRRCDKIKVDKYAPVISEINNPIYINGGNAKNIEDDALYNWRNSKSMDKTIALTVKAPKDIQGKNDTSGIAYWQYSYSRNSSYSKYLNSNKTVFTTTKYSDNRNALTYLQVCDNAGHCSAPASTRIKIDTELPNFKVGLYKKTSEANVNGSSGLSSYTSGSWYNKGVFTKAMDREDNLSGIASTTYTTSGAVGSNSKVSAYYYNINAVGSSYISYTVCDNAGNCKNSSTYTVKLDRTPPNGTITITNSDASLLYNSNRVNINLTATDDRSGIKTVKYEDPKGTQTFNGSGISWQGGYNPRKLIDSLSNNVQTANVKITVTDNAGNTKEKEVIYSTYAQCQPENTVDSVTESGWSACTKTCGSGTQTKTITTASTDSKTRVSCGSTSRTESQSCNTQACTKTCPTITVNGTSGSNGWYKAGTISLSHNGDSGYWTWYRGTTSLNTTSKTLSNGILEGTYTYKLVGQNREECTKSVSYDNTAPSCPALSVKTGTKGNNGWYRSSVTTQFTKTNDIAKWDWRSSYNDNYSTLSNSASTTYTINASSYQGTTALALNVYDTAGNSKSCDWYYYKIDTVAPTLTGVSNATLTHQMYSDATLSEQVFEGQFNISRSGDTYKGTICLKNIEDGAFRVNGIQGIWSDSVSGINVNDGFTNNASWFIDKDGNKVSRCNRTGSPCQYQFGMTVTDKAGNSADFIYVDMYAGYILNKGASNFSEPCYVSSYTKRYSKIIFDNTNWNINLNVK